MILRVVSGQVRSGELGAVSEAYGRVYVPVAAASVGLARFIVAARSAGDGHHISGMTLWTSIDAALEAYDGNLTTPRTLDGLSHGERLTRVDYYEVDATHAVVRAGGSPRHLRLTAGRVARGLDADIQLELRRALPSLPDEAREAWVGRRVLGADVQIAFVSTWSASPAGMALDEPLWTAIAARYDEFRVEVHDILHEGIGRA